MAKEGVHQLLLAAIGANIAWGIIDASMYIMNVMVVRRGKIRLVKAVQRAPDTKAALLLVKARVEPELQELIGPQNSEAFSKSVLPHIIGAQITGNNSNEGGLLWRARILLAGLCLVFTRRNSISDL